MIISQNKTRNVVKENRNFFFLSFIIVDFQRRIYYNICIIKVKAGESYVQRI